jgi:hypothetical protein
MFHPTLNGRTMETVVRPDSSRKIWWQCNKICRISRHPHAWYATLHNKNRFGCLVCSGTVVCQCPDHCNSLLYLYPDFAKRLCIDSFSNEKNITPENIAINDTRAFWFHGRNGCVYCSDDFVTVKKLIEKKGHIHKWISPYSPWS